MLRVMYAFKILWGFRIPETIQGRTLLFKPQPPEILIAFSIARWLGVDRGRAANTPSKSIGQKSVCARFVGIPNLDPLKPYLQILVELSIVGTSHAARDAFIQKTVSY